MALENKLGITDSAELAREEERISKKKAIELYDKGLLDGLEAGKFSALRFIHKYLFDVPCGILLTCSKAPSRYITGANLKLPFAMLTSLTSPANT